MPNVLGNRLSLLVTIRLTQKLCIKRLITTWSVPFWLQQTFNRYMSKHHTEIVRPRAQAESGRKNCFDQKESKAWMLALLDVHTLHHTKT